MRKPIFALLVVLLGIAATFSNPPQSIASPTVKAPARPIAGPATGWEQEWAKTLALAKQEGTVSIAYVGWTQGTVAALTKGFKDEYGINVGFTPGARGNDLTVKLQEQQRAGLHLIDLVGGGTNTVLNLVKPVIPLAALEPLLILPEVKDPKYWRGEKLPYVDRGKTYLALQAQKQHYIIYNPNLIKPGEITTYKDLLNPKYKGKITMNDPTVTGPGSTVFAHLAHNVWTLDETKKFLRQLIIDQQAAIQRDARVQVESVAKGKYAIGFGSNMTVIEAFLKAGAPIEAVITSKEGFHTSPASGGIAALANMPHPNAAKIFLNWVLSKEGMTHFMSNMGGVSRRTDVPVDAVRPLWRFYPGDKYFEETEESNHLQGDMIAQWKQIVRETTR